MTRIYLTVSQQQFSRLCSGARFLDPESGRFMTEDTYPGSATNPLSLNKYIYAEDNPMKYVDPTGYYAEQTTTSTNTVTTTETSSSSEGEYTFFFTEFTTTTYLVTTTCTADGCTSTQTVISVTSTWVSTVVNDETGQTCSSSSADASLYCNGPQGTAGGSDPNGYQDFLNTQPPISLIVGGLGLILMFGEGTFYGLALMAGCTVAAPETLGGSLVGIPAGAALFVGSLPEFYLGWYTFGYGLGMAARGEGGS